MSRQFFIQFKRHFPSLCISNIPDHNSMFKFAPATSGSGSQFLRMGTAKSARRKELASAGAGLRYIVFIIQPSLADLHHNILQLGFARQNSGEGVHNYKNQNTFSMICADAQQIGTPLHKFLHTSRCARAVR